MEKNNTKQSQVEESSQSKKLVAGNSKTPNEQMINEATNISDQASGDLKTTRGLQIDDKQNDQENERNDNKGTKQNKNKNMRRKGKNENNTNEKQEQNAPPESDDMETSPGNTKQQMTGDPSSGDIEKTGGQPIDEKQNDKKKERGKTSEESEQPTDLSTDDKQTGRLIEQNNTLTEENTVKDKKKRNQNMRLKEQKEALCKEKQELIEQNETLREKHKMLKNENTRLTSDIERLKDENTCLSSDIERIKTRCLSVSQQYGAQMNDEEFISYLHNENRRLTESLQEMTTERDNLQKSVKKATVNHDTFKEAAKKAIQKLKNDVEVLTDEKEAFKNKSETVQESANKLNKDFENLKKDLEENVEKCSHLSANIKNYTNQLCRKEEELKSVKSSLNSEKKDLKDQLKKMKSSHEEELKRFRVSREYEMEQWESSNKMLILRISESDTSVICQVVRILHDKVTQQEKLMLKREQEVQRLKDASTAKIKQLTSDVNMMKPYYEYYPQLESERQRIGIQLRNSEETIQTLRQETLELEKEKQNLLLRLSKLAGANLTYNNPNIADLSDEKRPTKLAEEFSELYDNEWTDGFEEVDISDEKTKTTFMLELLQLAYQLCHHVSTDHSENIQRSLSTLTVRMLETSPPAEQKSDENSEDTARNNEAEEKVKVGTTDVDKELLDSMQDVKTDNSHENEDQTIVAEKDENPDNKNNGISKDEINEPKKCHHESERDTDVERPNQNFKAPDGEKDEKNMNTENRSHSKYKNDKETTVLLKEKILGESQDIAKGEINEEIACTGRNEPVREIKMTIADGTDEGVKEDKNGAKTRSQTGIGIENENSQGEHDAMTADETDEARRSNLDKTVPIEAQQDVTEYESSEDARAELIPNVNTNTTEEHEVKRGEEEKEVDTEKGTNDNQICGELNPITSTSTTEEQEAKEDANANQVDNEIDTEDDQTKSVLNTTSTITTEEDKTRKTEKAEPKETEIDAEDKQISGESIPNSSISTTEGDEIKTDSGEKPVENKIEWTITTNLDTLNVRNEQKKAVQDIQKLVEKTLSHELQEVGAELIAKHKGTDFKKDVKVSAYIQKCINVCWSMCLQEPPVHVDFGDVTDDTAFDTNKYKPYTKSGKCLDFIVWPALYLHKGGPMLSKGVAQGRK